MMHSLNYKGLVSHNKSLTIASHRFILFAFLFVLLAAVFSIEINAAEGTMKIFAVNSANIAMDANLTVKVLPGTGKIYSSLDASIVGSTTQESERYAISVASGIVGNDAKNKNDFYIDIVSPAYSIDGPSAGGAMTLLITSLLESKQLPQDVSMTGTITQDGFIGNVGGIYEKSKKAAEVGIKLFMIPSGNRKQMISDNGDVRLIDLVDYAYSEWGMKIIEVNTIDEAMNYAYTDINSIDINSVQTSKPPEFDASAIDYSSALEPMRNIVDKYLEDTNSQLSVVEQNILSSSIKDTSILQDMLSVINYSKDAIVRADEYSKNNYLYSAANEVFLAKVNITAVNEIMSNPSILVADSTAFSIKLDELNGLIAITEDRSKSCSLERFEWCIGAKQRLVWAENKLDELKDNNSEDAFSRIVDYAYAVAWVDISNDFLDVAITDSKEKFVESKYFKNDAQQYIITVENKLVLLDPSYTNDEDVSRRLTAAKTDLEKGWYVTSLYDSSAVMAVIISKEQGDNELFDTKAFEDKYNYLSEKLKSSANIDKEKNIWSKLFFDHAVYFYNSYLFYQNKNDTQAKSDLRTANSITNIAYFLNETESKVLDYYQNADISEVSEDSNGSVAVFQDNYGTVKVQNISLVVYILLLVLAVVLLAMAVEARRLKKKMTGKKEFIQRQIQDIDEKLVNGEISQFTYRELRHKYLEDLKELKQNGKEVASTTLPVKVSFAKTVEPQDEQTKPLSKSRVASATKIKVTRAKPASKKMKKK